VLREASHTVMTRRPKTRRGRRNFTLEELLANAKSGVTEDAAPDLAWEISERFGDATNSEARPSCMKRSSKDKLKTKNGP
jgi:hypothetical protein